MSLTPDEQRLREQLLADHNRPARRLDSFERPCGTMLTLLDSLAAARERAEQAEAIIRQHDLCHDLHGKVGRDEFEEGCRRETVKEYGSCGWAERIAELEAENAALREAAKQAYLVLSLDARVGIQNTTAFEARKFLEVWMDRQPQEPQ